MPTDPVTGKKIPYTEEEQLELQAQALRQQRAQQGPLRQYNIAPPPTPQSVRTPEVLDNRLDPKDVARYRAAGEALTNPNRTVADVQRAVRDRVEAGRAVRGADDYGSYRDLNYDIIGRSPYVDRTPQPPTKPPNIATMEERYQAQGIELPKPAEKPSVLGFVKDILDYREGEGPIDYLKRKDSEGMQAPAGTRAQLRFGQTLGEATRRFLGEAGGGLNERLENYAEGRGFVPNPPAARPLDNISASSRAAMFAPRAGTVPATGSTGTPTIYRNADGSFSDTAGPGAVPWQPERSRISPLNRTGASPYADAIANGPVVNARAAQKRAELNARRLSGASTGGNILRDINRINRQAQQAYDQSIKQGLNVNVARDRAATIRGQADDLLRLEGIQSRERTDANAIAAGRERTAVDAALDQAAQIAGLTKEQQAQVRDNVAQMARGMVDPKSDDPEGEAARLGILVMANVPRNIDSLNGRQRAEALQQAGADASFVDAINRINPNFSFQSRAEMLEGLQGLNTRDYRFLSGAARDGILDALISEIMGHTEAEIPGTDEYFTVQRLEELRQQSRRGKRDLLRNPRG